MALPDRILALLRRPNLLLVARPGEHGRLTEIKGIALPAEPVAFAASAGGAFALRGFASGAAVTVFNQLFEVHMSWHKGYKTLQLP